VAHYIFFIHWAEGINSLLFRIHVTGNECVVRCVQAKCRIKELKYFDTHFSSKEAGKLAMYLNYVPYGQHVIVLTVGDAFSNMSDVAFNALSEVGIDIKDVVDRGQTFTAIIVLGSHCRTMYELHEHDLAHLDVCLKGKTNTIHHH